MISRASGEGVGSYNFAQGSLVVRDNVSGSTSGNYLIAFNGSANPFVINKASLPVTLSNASQLTKVYGDPDPAFAGLGTTYSPVNTSVTTMYNGSGVTINDVGNVVATLTNLTRASGEGVGSRGISAGTFTLTGSVEAANTLFTAWISWKMALSASTMAWPVPPLVTEKYLPWPFTAMLLASAVIAGPWPVVPASTSTT